MNIPRAVVKPAFDITRASHVILHVRDLAISRAFYADTLGMLVSDENPDVIYLRGLEEACHHSLVLKRSGKRGCERVGFRVYTEDDLDLLHQHCRDAGLKTAWVAAAFQSRTLHVEDVVGVPLEFCASMQVMPRAVNQFGEFKGACPMRLDHFQILSPELLRAWDFYSLLGFKTSEFIADEGSDEARTIFMQRKGNPHDLVFMRSPGPRLHHVAYTCPEAHHLMDMCDILASAGFGESIEFGPGRHFGPGYARYVYLRDPDGHRVEFFNNHYQTMDIEDVPLRWQPPVHGAASRWGRGSPESWRDEASEFCAAP